MKVIDALYTYGYRDRKLDKVIKKMKHGDSMYGLHVIVLPLCQDGMLEIYVYNQLLQPYYRSLGDDVCVLGVASDKAGAEELVLNIIQDMYDAGYEFDVKGFFGI